MKRFSAVLSSFNDFGISSPDISLSSFNISNSSSSFLPPIAVRTLALNLYGFAVEAITQGVLSPVFSLYLFITALATAVCVSIRYFFSKKHFLISLSVSSSEAKPAKKSFLIFALISSVTSYLPFFG